LAESIGQDLRSIVIPGAAPASFIYDVAFSRNLGWFTEPEQLALRGKRVAIAGLGGVGGIHLLTLARLGVGAFHIADLDTFELANFNRQVGATMQTLGRPKVDVLEEMAHAINPNLHIQRFGAGVTGANIEQFLTGVDLFVDGFDFFVIDMRRQVFRRCAELGIPAVTAAPVGMGTAFLAFMPGGMTFEQYFRLEGCTENEQYLRFLLGLAPEGLHRSYLVDPVRIDLAARRVPSTIVGCQLCAGVTAVLASKLLLGRGHVKSAPYHHHYDPYRGRLAISKLAYGNAGLVQRLRLAFARKALGKTALGGPRVAELSSPQSPLQEILNAARWAPSGDNEQPWRFEVLSDDAVAVHLTRPKGNNVYEYRGGEPLLLAGGMLLENLRIAATAHGRRMEWHREGDGWPDRIVVRFEPAAGLGVDVLYSSLGLRSVDRRRYRMRPLLRQEKAALLGALGDELIIDWYSRPVQRARFAQLSAQATNIRLRAQEAFEIHQRVIDWQQRLSPIGIPAAALGLDRLTLSLMRWAMRSWSRTRFLNRLGSPGAATLQMDYAPILACAACFTVRLVQATQLGARHPESMLRAGQHLQRFWLTATRLGLVMQPLLATLIFADYGEKSLVFTADDDVQSRATTLCASFRRVLGGTASDFIFIGRIGEPRTKQPDCRSVRRSLRELLQPTNG
jgi:molybdopterin/thiamine biosynthesis adenylyltransferase